MGGLLGNLQRMTDERRQRQAHWGTAKEARTNIGEGASWAWAEFGKRRCAVHGVADRCHRKKVADA